MKGVIYTIFVLIISLTTFAQSRNQGEEQQKTNKGNSDFLMDGFHPYVGLSGGYLFKNNQTYNDPTWHLKNGNNLELNFGFKKGYFGWSFALGYLTINRSLKDFQQFRLNSLTLYDSTTGSSLSGVPSSQISGLNNNPFVMQSWNEVFEYKPFQGYYLITGPNLWIGTGRLKVNVAIEGGLGLSKMGYYYLKGNINSAPDSLLITGPNPNTGVNDNYTVTLGSTNYQQFGMSEAYYNKVSNGNTNPILSIAQPYQFHFIGRLSGNLEYFVSRNISLHAEANFWYILTPKMVSEEHADGTINFKPADPKIDFRPGTFSYTNTFSKVNLTNLGVNLGIKFWFGGKHSNLNKDNTGGAASSGSDLSQSKEGTSLIVNVIDSLTKTPIGGVEVVLTDEDSKNEIRVVTAENGVATFTRIVPNNYKINGLAYQIPTTSTKISKSEFTEKNGTIRKTLFYTDPRFILKGVAINTETGKTQEDVQVNLTKGAHRISSTTTDEKGIFSFLLESNTDYQVQGLKSGLYSNVEEASTKGLKRSQTLYVTLKLGMSTVEKGKSFIVKNILYDFDQANIRPDAAIELNRLADFLKANPRVIIELSSHTDSRGSDSYNMALSQRRAERAVRYLISKGIARKRLIAKGYGETRLLNGCGNGVNCTEAQHQENRRTEIKILN